MAFIVRLTDSAARHVSEYGPFSSRDQADAFAAFLTAEVDPARTVEAPDDGAYLSPIGPLLAWYADSTEPRTTRRTVGRIAPYPLDVP